MEIHTTSQLISVDSLVSDDLFRISVPVSDNKFASRKISYDVIQSDIVKKAIEAADEKWGLSDLLVDQIDKRVSAIESGLSVSDNVVTFQNSPISKGKCRSDEEIPNQRQVKDLIYDYSEYLTPGAYVAVDPQNSSGNGTVYSDSKHQYHWRIDNGKMESESAKIYDTGYLTIYGWVASNEIVTAQESWLGLFGKVMTGDNDEQWVLIQAQPFIASKYQQVCQYVGFNISVKAGMELKIMTGFPVNASAGGIHVGRTLMFNQEGGIPNSFVGYVFQNER